ncbi:hypothetical protein Q4489_04265 [Thalassotalea sp. 1_MG-2023]|uniref:hypothetical protein n=1 Tax=Thalassotalea sp. 1_MG-2023 TaxID=3062680 RepID=UPI0026E1B9A1|nr:hypothetical protein [Thalassotalea sp. 1_MG-2023]MDO6426211.1 hypothetical protein [Thalassotalea sp. 1_MG-2023]
MDAKTFQQQYLGEFVISEEEKVLHNLAKQYHEETENYDRIVCSARNERGVAVPVNGWELVNINRNAREVKTRLLKENPSVSSGDLNKAISNYI